MEEENDDGSDDDTHQRSTPDWTNSITHPEEDQENKGNDPFHKVKNAHQENAAYPKQDANADGHRDGDTDSDEDVDSDMDWGIDANALADVDIDVQDVDQALESKNPEDPLAKKIKDLKGKGIAAEEQPITLSDSTSNDVMNALDMLYAGLYQDVASTSGGAVEAHQTPVSFQELDKLHIHNFMEGVDMDTMTSTPDWSVPGDLPVREERPEDEHILAQQQYGSTTPNWFTPASSSSPNANLVLPTSSSFQNADKLHSMKNVDMGKTPDWITPGNLTHEPHPERMPQGRQIFMYPLPDKNRLINLPIYNTYHHHHVHQLRKGNFGRSCPKSTSTDSSYHTHTSEHKPMKVETRLFTFNCDSSVVAYFRNNEVYIRVTSTQPATYTTLLVKHDLLEFVHHIVHRHDVHVVNTHYQDHFNLTSVCSQTCTRTKTQCRLFGAVGDFFHTHFHEFIHTIFVSAPIEEDATVYSEYLHLGTIRRPESKKAEDAQS